MIDLQIQKEQNFIKDSYKPLQWSSTETSLEAGQKSDFDKEPVLDRIEVQLKKSNIPINFTKKIDLSWAIEDLSRLMTIC